MSRAGVIDFLLVISAAAALVYGAKLRRDRVFRLRRESFDRHYRQYENEINSTLRQAEERNRRGDQHEDE